MISAFDVYLVMQLDSIIGFFVATAFIFGASLIPFGVFGFAAVCENELEAFAACKKGFLWAAPLFLLSIFMQAIIPSTKTAAAMIVLPAITSQEALDTLKPEMKELYELTKKSLENLTNPKEVEK